MDRRFKITHESIKIYHKFLDVGIASLSGSTGTVNMNGGDWNVTSTLYVGGSFLGDGGNGVLNVANASSVVNASALDIRPAGDVNISAGLLDVAGALTLRAASSLDLIGGRLQVNPNTFTIPAGTFNWTSGTLEFTTGYTVQLGSLLGGSALTIGANKHFIVSGLGVGTTQVGNLLISGGGTIDCSSATIGGFGTASVATLTVSGAGSLLDVGSTVTVSDETAGNFAVNTGAHVDSTSLFASSALGASSSNIDITGAGSLWTNSGSAYLGGGVSASVGAGTLDITTGGKLAVGTLLKVWEPYTVTLNGGTLESSDLELRGTLNATNTSTLKATGTVSILSGSDVTLSANSSMDFVDATVSFAGSSTIVGTIVGDALTNLTISSFGTTWTTPGSLEVGTSTAGPGHLGTLSLQAGTTTTVAGNVAILDVTKFTLAGGTLNATTFELGAQNFSGSGTINAEFHTDEEIIRREKQRELEDRLTDIDEEIEDILATDECASWRDEVATKMEDD